MSLFICFSPLPQSPALHHSLRHFPCLKICPNHDNLHLYIILRRLTYLITFLSACSLVIFSYSSHHLYSLSHCPSQQYQLNVPRLFLVNSRFTYCVVSKIWFSLNALFLNGYSSCYINFAPCVFRYCLVQIILFSDTLISAM